MIYLHVPFCRSFCTYCDFYSALCARSGASFDEYADAVLAEIAEREEEIRQNCTAADAEHTLYIGGGTPSVPPLSVLQRIEKALQPLLQGRGRQGLTAGRQVHGFREFTIEVNPEDIVEKGPDYVRGLLDLGVDRISMGVQSFDDGILRWMNRRHNAARAIQAYDILRTAAPSGSPPPAPGLPPRRLSISIDLIFGLSQLTDRQWNDTISKTLSLGHESGSAAPEHISAYQLSIEEGSILSGMVAEGRYVPASDEQARHQYDILCRRLAEAGYHHYEISNFALPGHEALHNSAYWHRVPYIGLGPGAHSYSRGPSGVETRSWNSRILPVRLPDGRWQAWSRESETLSEEDIRVEKLMLGLRTDRGLSRKELYALSIPAAIDRLLREGALEQASARSGPGKDAGDTARIRIPEDRFFTSDEILRELV